MMNFFRRVKPEAPVQRNNYFIQVDEDLAWSYSIGSEDSEEVSWATAEKNKAIEHHFFRSERQSLRRYVFSFLSFSHRFFSLHCYSCTDDIQSDSPVPVALYSRSARTFIRSPKSHRNPTFLAAWLLRFDRGAMMFRNIRARRSTRMCCWSIWTRSMRSRLRGGWI